MTPPHPDAGSQKAAEEAVNRAILMAADAIGELMGFWNFKPSMGRVWTVLYLSRRPMGADTIAQRTGLSAGSVSMTIQDLLKWGVIRRSWDPRSRRKLYEPETDILSMVTRVFREREMRVVSDAIARLEEALRVLDQQGRSSAAAQMLEGRFVATRVRHLVELARRGHALIDTLSRAGSVDLRTIRGALKSRLAPPS